MKMYRNEGLWNLVDQHGVLVCRGSWDEVREALKEYW